MSLFSDRLVERMKERKARQVDLVYATKASKGTVSKWVNTNTVPESKYLMPLAAYLRVSAEWLASGRGPKTPGGMEYEPTKKVPIISTVEAGQWTECVSREYVDDATEYQVTNLNVSDSAFALRVSGDSMTNPHGTPSLPEGSLIIVEPHPDPDNGKIVVAMLEGSDEATVKRLQIDGGSRYLVPLNPKYPVMEINGNCRIVGYVKQVIQNL